jgi:hypothetical protein
MQDTTDISGYSFGYANNIWLWIAIIEFAIILFLLFIKWKRDNKATQFKIEALGKKVDIDNIINSSFNSAALYNELKVKCHPDRFVTDSAKNEIANSIFQEIVKNKTNYKKLLRLKEEAKQKLNVNF